MSGDAVLEVSGGGNRAGVVDTSRLVECRGVSRAALVDTISEAVTGTGSGSCLGVSR